MDNQLQRAIDLIKKTNDKIIIFDNDKNKTGYVIMDLGEYEKIINKIQGLTEIKIIDKLNHNIADIKKNEKGLSEKSEKKGELSLDKNIEYDKLRKVGKSQDDNEETKKSEKRWTIPEQRKKYSILDQEI